MGTPQSKNQPESPAGRTGVDHGGADEAVHGDGLPAGPAPASPPPSSGPRPRPPPPPPPPTPPLRRPRSYAPSSSPGPGLLRHSSRPQEAQLLRPPHAQARWRRGTRPLRPQPVPGSRPPKARVLPPEIRPPRRGDSASRPPAVEGAPAPPPVQCTRPLRTRPLPPLQSDNLQLLGRQKKLENALVSSEYLRKCLDDWHDEAMKAIDENSSCQPAAQWLRSRHPKALALRQAPPASGTGRAGQLMEQRDCSDDKETQAIDWRCRRQLASARPWPRPRTQPGARRSRHPALRHSIPTSPPRRRRLFIELNSEKVDRVSLLKAWPEDDGDSFADPRTFDHEVTNKRKDSARKDKCKKKFNDAIIPRKVFGTAPVTYEIAVVNPQLTTVSIHDEADLNNTDPRATRIKLPDDASGEKLGNLLKQLRRRGFQHFVYDDVFRRAVLHFICIILEASFKG